MNTTEPCGGIAKLYCDTTKIPYSTPPLPMINKDRSLSQGQVTPCPPPPQQIIEFTFP